MTKNSAPVKRLVELKKGSSGYIHQIAHSSPEVKQRLNSMGLYKGCPVKRKNSVSPLVIDANGVDIVIGKTLAEYILISSKKPADIQNTDNTIKQNKEDKENNFTLLIDTHGIDAEKGLTLLKEIKVSAVKKTIFLMGNPNVGKSTMFSRLTGIKTDASNYPGTTVSLLKGEMNIDKNLYTIYDMPGIYSLHESSRTEEEACKLIKNKPYDIAVYVADSQHLERNLFFALDILALGKPTVLVLNKFDIAQKKGIAIDPQKLSAFLGVPVIPSNSISGKGLKELSDTIAKLNNGEIRFKSPKIPTDTDEKWKLIGKISAQAQRITHRHPTLIERLEDAATSSWLGLPIAFFVMIASFFIIRFLGESCIDLLTPLYEEYYLPFMQNLFAFTQNTFVYTILFGSSSDAAGGLGILSEGIKIAFVDVLPYVVSFYAVLDFLSMLGYLPRLAILLDSLLHKIGLHGYSAIPIMLGLGCKVPAIMAVRSLETKRQKLIALALILIMVPCISQSAMMFSVVAPYGIKYLITIFAVMLFTGIATGAVLNKILSGDTADIFMEVPSWQWPKLKPFLKQLVRRAKDFIKEAIPLIIAGMFIITVADMLGLIDFVQNSMKGLIIGILGLPKETASAILLGFLRKDVSIGLLIPFALTAKQMVVACIFMAMYMPCTASFFVLLREGGLKDGFKVIALTFTISVVLCGLLNLIL